jgi:hypothetical protein
VSSAAELQGLAELESLPDIIETEVKRVTICHVSWEERKRIEEKAEVSQGVEESIIVIFDGRQRAAIEVTSLKKGVELVQQGEERGMTKTLITDQE